MRRTLAVLLLTPALAWGQPQAQFRGQPADQAGSAAPPIQQQWDQQGQNPVSSLNAPMPGDAVLSGQSPGGDQGQEDQGQEDQSRADEVGGDPSLPPPANQGPATFARANVWVPATVAKIQALDKVDSRAKDFALKIGQSATFGSLTITLKACVVRPPDQPADAAAFLEVTDSHPDSGNFNGWMLENEPSVSMLQNPIYDVRVDGCT